MNAETPANFDWLEDELPDDIDPEIRPLVVALNSDGIRTTSSCWGHGEKPAVVELLVRGSDRLRELTWRLSQIKGDILNLTMVGLQKLPESWAGLSPFDVPETQLRLNVRFQPPGSFISVRSRGGWVQLPDPWLAVYLDMQAGGEWPRWSTEAMPRPDAAPSKALLAAVAVRYRLLLEEGASCARTRALHAAREAAAA